MIKWLVLFMLLSFNSYAGISVCHTGETVTKTTLRGNQLPGCEFYTESDPNEYDRVKDLIKTVPRPYLKFTTQLEEKTQQEKDDYDSAQVATQLAAIKQSAKDYVDTGQDADRRMIKALAWVIFNSMVETRQSVRDTQDCIMNGNNMSAIQSCVTGLTPLADRTWDQLKAAVKNEIDQENGQ